MNYTLLDGREQLTELATRESRDAQVTTGRFVTLLQFQRHRKVIPEPQGKGGKRLPQRQRMIPRLQRSPLLLRSPAARDGVQQRHFGAQGWIVLANHV